MLYSFRRIRSFLEGRSGSLPAFFFGLGTCLSLLFWWQLRQNDQRGIAIEVSGRAREAANALSAGLEWRYQAMERQAASWSFRGGIARAEWERDAALFMRDTPGIEAISWVSADGVVRWGRASEASRRAIGYDLDLEHERHRALNQARSTGLPVTSRPIKLLGGEEVGFISIFPVTRHRRPDGFLVAVYELRSAVSSLTRAEGYRLAIYGEKGTLLYRQNNEGDWAEELGARAELRTGTVIWYLEATPSRAVISNLQSHVTLASLLIGLLLSGFVAALVREILARRQAEARVRLDLAEREAAQETFRVLFENSTDAQFLVDEVGIIDCNPSTVRILGADSKEEIVGSHPARFSPAVQPDGSHSGPQTEQIAEGIRRHGFHKFEWTHCRLNGTLFRAEVTVITVEHRGRAVQLVTWHDLTQRVAAEEKFRLLFEHSSDAHLLVGNGGIIESNPATLHLFAAKQPGDLRHKHPFQLSPDIQPDGRRSHDLARAALARLDLEKFYRADWTLRRLDGTEFPALVTLKTASYRGETVYLATIQDLTEQKSTQAKLLESSKMSSLGEMASGMAHELNNPLAVIKGKADRLTVLAGREQISAEELTRHLAVIDSMVNRMAKIIHSLRFFARESSRDSMELVTVDAVLTETLALCQTRFASHEIKLHLPPVTGTELYCRPVQISQILLNLLGNAFDAVATQEKREVSITVGLSGDLIEIAVEDSGPGVPAELRSKIMQPFFTTKEVGKGTGLGLSISAGLAESNGGKLSLEDSATGTRFTLRLPAASVAMLAGKKQAAA